MEKDTHVRAQIGIINLSVCLGGQMDSLKIYLFVMEQLSLFPRHHHHHHRIVMTSVESVSVVDIDRRNLSSRENDR